MNLTGIQEDVSSIPELTQRVKTWHCHELFCRSQMRLGSGVAVAVASTTAPIRPLAWEIPYAMGLALKSQKQKPIQPKN